MLTSGRTKSVQDAPTTNDHSCTDAKPSECPKGDRDNKSELYFKNILFLQTVTAVFHNGGSDCRKTPICKQVGDRDNKSEVYFINRLFYPIS